MTIAQILAKYPPRGPLKPPENDDEVRLLLATHGVRLLGSAPADNETYNAKPLRKGAEGCHLWVLDSRGVPYILERADVAGELTSGLVKHTNLTGGEPACCGGELWFASERASRLFINGCSGRYRPVDGDHLAAAADVFKALGYDVVSFGWDADAGQPSAVLE